MASFDRIKKEYQWVKKPLIACAPMRPYSTADLAIAVSMSGGFGVIAYTPRLAEDLAKAKSALPALDNGSVPVGAGFIMFYDDLESATATIADNPPAAAWLFGPGFPDDLKKWSNAIREVSRGRTKIWVQVGSIKDALEAITQCGEDIVLVGQGSDAGGHGLAQGSGITTTIPGIIDALAKAGYDTPVLAAGGIVEARGAAAALVLGASGVVLGTRFIASTEAAASPAFLEAMFAATDGGQETVRSRVYDDLIGVDWPPEYDGRNLINRSYIDKTIGVSLEEIKKRFQESMNDPNGHGSKGRLATYVGAGVGLVSEVKSAAAIVDEIRTGVHQIGVNSAQILCSEAER